MQPNISRPATMQENPDYQVYIVNLSTINKLKPISEVLDQFADLHYQYAQSWLHYKWYSKLWVSSKYLTMTRAINDYKLGTIDTDTFIGKLHDIFYFIPANENPTELLKKAWNSLIAWDKQSTQRLNYLIEKNQAICLISNTNALNIQKIKQDIDTTTKKTWDWQEKTEGKCQFQTCGNFKLMTSYANGMFKTDGLIEKLVTELSPQLTTTGKIDRKSILLVSQYDDDLAKADALNIKKMKADEFFPAIPAPKLTSASQTSLNSTVCVTSPTTTPVFSPLPNDDSVSRGQSFFRKALNNQENRVITDLENTPLLRR